MPNSPADQIFSVNEGLERGYATGQIPSDAADLMHAAGESGKEKVLVVDSSRRYLQRHVIPEFRGAPTTTGPLAVAHHLFRLIHSRPLAVWNLK